MRWALGAAVAAVVAVLALTAALVLAPSGKGRTSTLVAVHPQCSAARLAWVDSSTLEPRGGKELDLGGYFEDPVRSPDRKTVALGGHSGTIVLANVESMRRVATIRIASPGEYTFVVAWPASDRLVATTRGNDSHIGLTRIVVVDPAKRQVERELTFEGKAALAGGATRTGLVPLLVESEQRLDAPRVVFVGRGGVIHGATIGRLRAGTERSSGHEARSRFPGFAVDPENERAFVINQGQPVGVVDLRTLEVRYHDVARLAAPAPGVGAPTHRQDRRRIARWLGSGLVAVTGMDTDLRRVFPLGADMAAADRERIENASVGLQLLDTRSWTVRTLDPRVNWFEWQGDHVVAYARPVSGSGGDALVAFDRTGRLAYRLHGTEKTYWRGFNDRIYLFGDRRSPSTTVLDARNGRKVGHAQFDRLLAVGPC